MTSKDNALEVFVSQSDRLKDLMMDLLSTTIEVSQKRIATLSDKDWEAMTQFVRDHRIGPMLHWRINQTRKHLTFPEVFLEDIGNRYRANTFTNLAAERELILVSETLYQAEIPFVVLKGGFLAWHVYPEKGLRPLRDLDILVAKERALEAFNALMKAGASRMKGDDSDPALMLDHPEAHQLPPIVSKHGTLVVEMHWLLFHHHQSLQNAWDLTEDKSLWKRGITATLHQGEVPFLSPTDQLVHLIEHAFHGHLLDNGPLVLSDIAFLLEKYEMDWALLDRLIKQAGLKQATRLGLAMVYRDHGVGSFTWLQKNKAEPYLLEAAILNARRLMLRDYGKRKYIGLSAEMFKPMAIMQKCAWAMKLFFAPKIKVALEFNVDQASPFLWCYYPIRWARQIFIEIPHIFLTRIQKTSKHETLQMEQLRAWLQKKDEA